VANGKVCTNFLGDGENLHGKTKRGQEENRVRSLGEDKYSSLIGRGGVNPEGKSYQKRVDRRGVLTSEEVATCKRNDATDRRLSRTGSSSAEKPGGWRKRFAYKRVFVKKG